jgi:hypothetical protein
MTIEELRQLIADVVSQTIDERLAALLGRFDVDEDVLLDDAAPDTRTWEQVKEDVERHRWTPPPGTPSVTQFLREDRDR